MAKENRAMTPTTRTERLRADFSELIMELNDGNEFRFILDTLTEMQEDQLFGEHAQEEISQMMSQAIQCLSRATDLA